MQALVAEGARVCVVGRYRNNVWTDAKDGGRRSRIEVAADEVSASLRWATAVLTRTPGRAGDEPPALDEPPF